MDKAKSIVTAATQAMARAADEAKAALAGMTAGLSVAGITAFVKSTIEATAGLRNLSVQAGMTVESLSALAAVGKSTSTGADAIAAASNKLSKAMAVSNEESKGAATALKALGLNFDAFQKLTPDQRIQQVAMAMGMFNDGAQKSAAAMLLFGKAGAEMLPFLKDLAQTGQLHAKITDDQAEAAHRFEVSIGKLKVQADAWKKQLALELLPTLDAITQELLAIKAASGDKGPSLLGETIKTVFETISSLGVNVLYVLKQTAIELGGIAAQAGAILTLNWGRVPGIRSEMVADSAEARRQVDQRTSNLLGITNSTAGAGRGALPDPRVSGIAIPDFHRDLTGLAGDGTGGQAKAETDAYNALINSIQKKIDLDNAEVASGGMLSNWQKLEIDLRSQESKLLEKYPGLSKSAIDAKIAEAVQSQKNADLAKSELEQAKQIAVLRQQQKNSDYDQSAAGVRDIANAYQQQLKSIKDNIQAEKDKNEADALAASLNISVGEAVQMVTIARLEEAKAKLVDGSDGAEAVQKEIDARKELLGLLHSKADFDKAQQMWKDLDTTAKGVWDSILQSGGNVWTKLRDQLKSSLWDLLYQMTIHRWIINIGANVSGSGTSAVSQMVGGSSGMGATGNLTGSMMNMPGMLGMAGAGMQALTGASVGASGASLGIANGVGAMGGDSLGTLIAANGSWAGVSAGAGAAAGGAAAAEGAGIAAGTLGAEGAAAGAGAAGMGMAGMASMIPVVGWVIAAAAVLYSIFGQKGGGPKQDGTFGLLNSSIGQGQRSAGNDQVAQTAAQGLQQQYDSIIKAYGGQGGIQYGMGFSMDPQGTAPTMLDITGSRNGQTAFSNFDAGVGRSQQELTAAIASMGSKAILKGLQESGLDSAIGDYLKKLGDIDAMSDGAISQAIAKVQKAAGERASIEDQILAMTSTATEQLAHARELEKAAIDDTNYALLDRLHNLQAEKAAADSLAVAIDAANKAQATYATFIGQTNQSIRQYLDKLDATGSTVSPENKLSASNAQFQQQLQLARGGDQTARQNITQYADQLIQAQIGYSASGGNTGQVIDDVKAQLEGLPQMVTAQEYLAQVLQDTSAQQVDATKAAGDKIWDGLWGSAGLLSTKFDVVDKDVNGLLDFNELKAALGPIATDDTVHALVARVDTNGDGQLSRLEIINASIWGTAAAQVQAQQQTQQAIAAASASSAAAVSALAPTLSEMANYFANYHGGAYDPRYAPTSPVGPIDSYNSYAIGINSVPYDMTANIHQGEAIIPKAFNPWAGGTGLGMDSAPIVQAISTLTAKVDNLTAVVAAGARGTIDGLGDVADNTAASARATALQASMAPVAA